MFLLSCINGGHVYFILKFCIELSQGLHTVKFGIEAHVLILHQPLQN